MADTSLAFDIFARDHGAARAFRRVSDDMEGLRDSTGRLRRDSAQLSRATDELARSETSMGLAARQAGLKVEEAMNRAATARRRAEQAAERLARGEISEAEAARLTERAERDLEKATLAAALASQAAARAADQHAEQLRQVARDAALAGAAEQLALLRASGDRRAHNALLAATRRQFGDLGTDSNRTFHDMESLGRRAFGTVSRSARNAVSQVGDLGRGLLQSWPALLEFAAIGIAALPVAAIAAGGAITLALGGALAGVGILAVASSKEVKASFGGLASDAKRQAALWAAPFKPALRQIAFDLHAVLTNLGPSMTSAFAQMAPAVQRFASQLAVGLSGLAPDIAMIGDGFTKILDQLGPQLPALLANVGDGLAFIAQAAGNHAAEFAQFANAIGYAIRGLGIMTAGLIETGSQVQRFFGILDFLGGGTKNVGGAMDAAAASTLSTGAAMGTMGVAVRNAAGAIGDLKTRLDELTGKTLSSREIARAYESAIDDLTASLKENGRTHDIGTAKGRANQEQLDKLARSAQANAVQMDKTGRSTRDVGLFMDGARAKIVAAGIKMGYSAVEADLLATKILGVTKRLKDVPPGKRIKITADISAAMQNIHTVGAAAAALGAGIPFKAKGGYIGPGYRAGGAIRGYANAGLVTGAGTGTSDDIPIMASNGEYMMRAASVAKNRAALDAANFHGAQLAVRKKKAWSKTTYSPWNTASIKPPAAPKPVGQSASVPGMPYWWRGQADTAFGPGRAHFAWGSARPDMAASVTAVTPKAVKPKSPWGNAQVGWNKESAKPAQLVIRSDGSKASNAVVALLRDAIQQGGGDVQKFLGVSS